MIETILNEMSKDKIRVIIERKASETIGASRFGGKPDVPDEFDWPYYCGENFGVETKNRPLSFMCQINCEEASQYDSSGLLPQKGLLSFFYEEETARWGYSPKDKGCAKVYWFEDVSSLSKMEFPEDLYTDYRNPEIGISFKSEKSYPHIQDIDFKHQVSEEEYDEYEEFMDAQDYGDWHQLLGWPYIIQNNMTMECELIERGYELGDGWDDVNEKDREEANLYSLDKWILLFQLDEIESDDFYLSFGDGGILYYYIKKEDLLRRKFDDVWLIYQCC